ncbi:unnamed protein product [Adineta ricciae]|uniref:peptidylprolyl isomerase n=1 Tax=Adineta ricciae TaxID=249248 RepID=A0A814VJW2_ADIRI|nr:unnamed protein product [Adineta ricciae]
MTDELSIGYSYQKRSFISKLNPESPPFHPSSFYQQIQRASQPESSLNNYNNHFHIQPVTNEFYDNHNYSCSTTIHPIEPTDHQVSHSHYIEKMIPNSQHPTTSSHIEPLETSSSSDLLEQPSSQTSTNIHEEEISNHHEDSDENNAQHESTEEEIPVTQTETNALSAKSEHTANELSTSLPDIATETLDQNEPDDVLGNSSLLKQTITPGTIDTRPLRNTLATVSYKLYLVDDLTKDSRLIETVTNESFFIAEYEILPAIDIVIQLMDRGEHALIDSDVRHCYGENGCEEKQIPPVTSTSPYRMRIELELIDWKDAPDISTLPINERLQWSDKKRQRGNFCYRRKDYASALQSYRNALKFLDIEQNPLLEEEEIQSATIIERFVQVQNNLAQVYLLNNQYEQCLEAVNAVLKHDSKNVKALFRHGKALFELGNYDEAVPPLRSLLQNPSKDVEKDKVTEMLKICETKLAKYKKNEKEIYTKMFQSKTPSSTTTAAVLEEKKSPKKPVEKVATKTKSNNNWWTYVAMGSAVVAAVGLGAIIKYR